MTLATVGLIANPASGRDIRRLVAHGTVFDNQEKISIVRRLALALLAGGAGRLLYMPDYHGLAERALEGLGFGYSFRDGILRSPAGGELRIAPAETARGWTQADTVEAARLMEEAGAGCLLVLGGDGTSRAAAKGAGNTPLLPLSTGTNNVFPYMAEATTAGLAAAFVAAGGPGLKAVYRAKRLAVLRNGRLEDIALVDVAVTGGGFVGSRAVWETEGLREAFFTRGEPGDIGLASVVGKSRPLSPRDPAGAHAEFDPRRRDLMCPVAPGIVLPVGLARLETLLPGEGRDVPPGPAVLARDGEREVELRDGDRARVVLDPEGPLVVDLPLALRGSVEEGFYRESGRLAALA